MKRKERTERFLAVLLAFLFTLNFQLFNIYPLAKEQSLEEQKKEYQQKINDADERLSVLVNDRDKEQEYCDLLENKISYLQKELEICEKESEKAEKSINSINNNITNSENYIKSIEKRSKNVKIQLDGLYKEFDSVYDEWKNRVRCEYISGTYSVLEILLTSDGVAQFLTRLEMINAVSKHDGKIMMTVNSSIKKISDLQKELADNKVKTEQAIEDSKQAQIDLKVKRSEYLQKQEELSAKKLAIDEEKRKNDIVLKKLTEKTKMYSEYRTQSEEELQKIENEIRKQIGEAEQKYDGEEQSKPNRDILNLMYPVPDHTDISAGYPNYSSGKYHGGVDFPCPTGTNVVASQSGTVSTVKKLKDSYGKYIMIYHGKNIAGKSVVTLYAHNSELLVREGQYVQKGEVIAKSGSTGNSTGPHCHFEVRIDKKRVNPLKYLK